MLVADFFESSFYRFKMRGRQQFRQFLQTELDSGEVTKLDFVVAHSHIMKTEITQ